MKPTRQQVTEESSPRSATKPRGGSARFTFLVIVALMAMASNCAYFNTFYLAKKNFADAEYQFRLDEETVKSETQKKYRDAIEWSAEVVRSYPESRYVDDSMYILAMSAYRLKEYFDAFNRFDTLVSTFPDSKYVPEARYFAARSLLASGSTDLSRARFSEIFSANDSPMAKKAGLALAEITREAQSWSDLLVTAQAVIDGTDGGEEHTRAVLYKAEALFNLDRTDEALAAVATVNADKLIPELRFKANSLLASATARNGRYDEALAYLTVLENRGDMAAYAPGIRLEIGKIQELGGDTVTAIDTYKKLAGDFPDSLASFEAWYRTGILLLGDLSRADEARTAFDMASKLKQKTPQDWFVDAAIKTTQIDSVTARLARIKDADEDSLTRARTRFSLAELYAYSLGHPDSASTHYRAIIQEAPGSDYAVRSEFFLERARLESSDELTTDAESSLMRDIINRYPDSVFAQKLKVHLGLILHPPDVAAFRRAEDARDSGSDPESFLPLFQAVVDSFPDSENAYRAKLVLAYSYEHDLNDMDTALKLYKALASEPKTPVSAPFVALAYDKLDYYAREPEMRQEIERYLAGFTSSSPAAVAVAQQQQPTETTRDDAFSGVRRIRARNARIRSRYFTN